MALTLQTQINMTSVQSALKELYVGQDLAEFGYRNRPFFAMVKKNTDLWGYGKPLPVRFSHGITSAAFSNAQSNIVAPAQVRFFLQSVAKYSLAQIDRKTLKASAHDEGAFIAAIKVAVNGAVDAQTEALSVDLYCDGTGQRSTIGSISTGVITLGNKTDVVRFALGQKINAINAGATRGAAGFVIARSATAGTITVATALNGSAATPAGWTAGDGLCMDGDFNACLHGLEAWMPDTVSGSDNFMTVNRSVDTRLSGLIYDGSSSTIEDALQDGVSLCQQEGGRPDAIFTGPASFSNLVKSMGTRAVYQTAEIGEGEARLLFKGVELQTAYGVIPVFQDPFCNAKKAYALQMDTWELDTTGPTVEVQTDMSTGELLRVYNQDAGELRVSSYPELGCAAPGNNIKIKLPA